MPQKISELLQFLLEKIDENSLLVLADKAKKNPGIVQKVISWSNQSESPQMDREPRAAVRRPEVQSKTIEEDLTELVKMPQRDDILPPLTIRLELHVGHARVDGGLHQSTSSSHSSPLAFRIASHARLFSAPSFTPISYAVSRTFSNPVSGILSRSFANR